SYPNDGQRPRPAWHRLPHADDRRGAGFGDQWHRRTDGGKQRKSLGRQCREAVGVEIESPHRERKMIIPLFQKEGPGEICTAMSAVNFPKKSPLNPPF